MHHLPFFHKPLDGKTESVWQHWVLSEIGLGKRQADIHKWQKEQLAETYKIQNASAGLCGQDCS